MAVLTVSPLEGALLTVDCDQTGDEYPNDGSQFPIIFNDSASPINVTRKVQTQPPWPDVCEDRVSTIPANEMVILSALPARRFNTTLNRVQITYPDGQASNLRIAVVRIPHAL